MVGMVDDQSGNKFGQVNNYTNLSVEKNESIFFKYKPMDIHMLLYIYSYLHAIYDVFICTYLCIPALCTGR